MVSDLKGVTYEEKLLEPGIPTLEERRHQDDMVQTFMIVKGIDKVQASTWFRFATEEGRATRIADCPLNLQQKAARLDVHRNFFSSHKEEDWNKMPSGVESLKTVSSFKGSE
jgi:hypothetical protein